MRLLKVMSLAGGGVNSEQTFVYWYNYQILQKKNVYQIFLWKVVGP